MTVDYALRSIELRFSLRTKLSLGAVLIGENRFLDRHDLRRGIWQDHITFMSASAYDSRNRFPNSNLQ